MKNNIVYTVGDTVYQVIEDNSGAREYLNADNDHYHIYREDIRSEKAVKQVAKNLAQKKKSWEKQIYDNFLDISIFAYLMFISIFTLVAFGIFNSLNIPLVISLYATPFVILGIINLRDKIVVGKPVKKQYEEVYSAISNMKTFPLAEKNTYEGELSPGHFTCIDIVINKDNWDFLDVLHDPYKQIEFSQIFDLLREDDLTHDNVEQLEEAIENYLINDLEDPRNAHLENDKYSPAANPYDDLINDILQNSKREPL